MLHLSDIKLPEGVEIPGLVEGDESDQGIVSIHVIKAAPIEEDEVVEGEEGEEGEAVEGEEGEEAEGDESAAEASDEESKDK